MKGKKQAVIAIVDDDSAILNSMRHFVQSLGYVSHTFLSGEEFLTSRTLLDTDCLIVDLRMPGMSGIELQRRLVLAGRKLPIIFIAACAEAAERDRALAADAVGFLDKPYRDESLIACLDKALSAPNA